MEKLKMERGKKLSEVVTKQIERQVLRFRALVGFIIRLLLIKEVKHELTSIGTVMGVQTIVATLAGALNERAGGLGIT